MDEPGNSEILEIYSCVTFALMNLVYLGVSELSFLYAKILKFRKFKFA